MNLSRENNFDLLRLFAAFQIMLTHYYNHVHFSAHFLNGTFTVTRPFSGIMMLFTISGFLIFASFDNSDSLYTYFRNRFLRIYPALWTCLLVTISLLAILGYINATNVFSKPFIIWFATQVSFLQFYTPDMLRSFGVGTPNGSLWTIPVEISFYVLVPCIFFISKKGKLHRNIWLMILIMLSVAYNIYYQHYKFQAERSNLVKLMGVNLMPYLFYFLLGALAYTNWERIEKWYKGKGLYWMLIYIAYYVVCSVWLKKFEMTYWTGFYHFIAVVLFSQTTISLAFTRPSLSSRILRHNDISYGIYAYHMLAINVLLTFGYGGHDSAYLIVLVTTMALAILSWKFVERPALLLKRKTINPEIRSVH